MMTPDRLNRRSAMLALGSMGACTLAYGAQESRPASGAKPPGQPGGTGGVVGATGAFGLTPAQLGWNASTGKYVLPPLPYPPNALEPHIDAETMRLHHGKHHASYVDGLNKALDGLVEARSSGNADHVAHWSRELAFNGAGHVNHAIFWLVMAPAGSEGGGDEENGGGRLSGDLAKAIARDFGSFVAFSKHFKTVAEKVEGSGWAWLVHEPIADRLLILPVEKHQNHMLVGVRPILGVDVWEHSYYLKHRDDRAAYLDAFLNVVNWERAAALLQAART